jgi:NitT/TauT family transport system substrate-binding protein
MSRPGLGALTGLLGGILLLGLAGVDATGAGPLRVRYAVWVGYGPLFLAQQKGYFAAEKVEIELRQIEDPGDAFRAIVAGQLDGLVSTIDAEVSHLQTGREYQCVLALDDSAGGDGIVARKEIKSIRDLKGKRVAVLRGSVSEFFLGVLLRDAGLSERDLEVVNMKHGDAGAALVAGKVDAAVTWEPWLSKAKTAPHGHVLVDSSQTPGLITDVMVFRRDVIETRAAEIQGAVRGWHRAVAYWKKNPAESNAIMAKGMGDWLEDPRLFADMLTGVRFYDQPANTRFFGTPQQPGPLYRTIQNAMDIASASARLRGTFAPADLVTHAFVK